MLSQVAAFLLSHGRVTFHCMCILHLPYLSSDRHSGCFHALTIVKNAAVTMGTQVSLQILISVPFHAHPEVDC